MRIASFKNISIRENIRKFLLYLLPTNAYWQTTKKFQINYYTEFSLGFYPLSIEQRIKEGHYGWFDNAGIPRYPNDNGRLSYHATTITSYTLGVWERLLKYGSESDRNLIERLSDKILSMVVINNGISLLPDPPTEKYPVGAPCAMNQGEAISVFCRSYLLFNNKKYLDMAYKLADSFLIGYDEGGVLEVEPETSLPWYPEGGKFILNGNNYALFGLYELYKVSHDESILAIFKEGINSLENILPQFYTGYWSWYWLDNPKYIASMMYHNLHICQLTSLAEMSGSEVISEYAFKFEKVAANPIYRLRAAWNIFNSKINNRVTL